MIHVSYRMTCHQSPLNILGGISSGKPNPTIEDITDKTQPARSPQLKKKQKPEKMMNKKEPEKGKDMKVR